MRRLPAVLITLVLVLGLLATLSYTLLSSGSGQGEGGDAAPSVAGTSEPASPDAADELSQPDAPAEEPASQLSQVASSEERSAAATEEYDPERVVRVAGRVLIPAGTPADESIEVLVLEHAGHPWITDDDDDGEPVTLVSGQRIASGQLIARVPVEPTGAFEFELAPDVDTAFLRVHGRYVFASEAVRVTRDDTPSELELDVRLGAWISGRVLLPRDLEPSALGSERPRVRLQPDERQGMGQAGFGLSDQVRRRETQLDEDLAFAWGGTLADVRYDLRMRSEGLAAHKSAHFDPRPGEHIVMDLALTRGGSLSGIVRGEDGEPIAEAELSVEVDPLMMGLGGFEVREGESDAQGRFQLDAVLAGELVLVAEKDGFLAERMDVEVLEGGATAGLEVTLSSGASIRGVLRWPDGSAVAEVEVDATFDMSNLGGMGAFNAMVGPRGEDDTDAEGAFAISGLGKGPFTVSAQAERDGRTWHARQDAVAPDTEGLELVLEEPIDVSGRVVDEMGEPVTEFEVRARTQSRGMIAGLGAQTASDRFEDDQGKFTLEGLSENTWTLAAGGQGYGDGEPLELALPLVDPNQEIVLVLPHAAVVEGTVLDPDGRPIAGASVREQATLQGIGARVEGREPPEAFSDEEGHFRLEGLTPGVRPIEASRDGFAKSEPVSVELAPSQQRTDVVLNLRVGGRIVGEIFDNDGELKSGATILAQSPTDMSNQLFASSDGDGRFQFDNVAPGSWQVMTMPDRGGADGVDEENFAAFFSEMKLQMAEVADGEEVFVQLGAPPEDPVEVTGTVLLDGEPQEGVMISFILDTEEASQPKFLFTTSDRDGQYKLQLDQPGKYLVQAQMLAGLAGQQQNLQLSATVPEKPEYRYDIDLPVGAISGLVRGPDGKPAGGVRVSLMADGPISNLSFFGGNYAEISTEADGTYELIWLREGTFSVSAGGPILGGMFGAGGDDTPGRMVRSGVKVKDGQRTEGVDFRLESPGKLVGTVRDSTGAPVSGVGLFLRDEAGQLVERISLVATDGAGHFKYSGLAPGRYTVTARDLTLVTGGDVAIDVREGAETKVELTLAPGTMLKVVLSDREGNPVDCSVSVSDSQGRQVNGSWTFAELMAWSSSGSFSSKEQSVGPLPPGKYRVEASSSDGKSATKNVTLNGQAQRKLKLRLRD